MTDQEREDKIKFLADRIKASTDAALQRADAELMTELIKQRPADYIAAMEREMGLAA